ncbi:anaerobic C4-dicarboxylate transporter, partial [Vibrio parahaemolyticus]|nr:anaerobic C4-dicarboxylate transporter [Vibrio parahaemolyticus]
WREKILITTAKSLDEVLPKSARNSVLLFIASIFVIVVIAMWPDIRTIVDGEKPISMAVVIQMMMLFFGCIILLTT